MLGCEPACVLVQNTVLSAKRFLERHQPGKWNIAYSELSLQKPVPRFVPVTVSLESVVSK